MLILIFTSTQPTVFVKQEKDCIRSDKITVLDSGAPVLNASHSAQQRSSILYFQTI